MEGAGYSGSLKSVMPDSRSLPRTLYGGIQKILKILDSGFRRNDASHCGWDFRKGTKGT